MHLKNRPVTLNILFIGESYLGGMAGSKRIQNIINSLRKNIHISISNLIIEGHNIHYFKSIGGNLNSINYENIYYNIRNPLLMFYLYIKGFLFIAKAKKNNSKNIVYCYDSPTIINFPFLIFSRLLGMKVVIDFVEDYGQLDLSYLTMNQKIKFVFYRFLERKIFLFSNGIFVISSHLQKKFYEIINNRIPIMHLPITVDFDLYRSEINKNSNGTISIFYGGSFGEKDGLIYLLRAFERLVIAYSNIELVLAGRPNKNGHKSTIDFIEKSKAKNKIRYLGYLKDVDYYETLQNSDIFCMSRINSRYANAGFPFKLGEMLATGKPVVATKVGDVDLFLSDKINAILIEPDSTEEIVLGITYLIDNPLKAYEIGINGRSVARKYFDSDLVSESIVTFLYKL